MVNMTPNRRRHNSYGGTTGSSPRRIVSQTVTTRTPRRPRLHSSGDGIRSSTRRPKTPSTRTPSAAASRTSSSSLSRQDNQTPSSKNSTIIASTKENDKDDESEQQQQERRRLKRQRREARRDRRFKRRLLLLALLALAASPSLVAMFYYHQYHYSTMALSRTTATDQQPDNALLLQAAQKLELQDNPFVPPEQKDPNFGLPPILVVEEDEQQEQPNKDEAMEQQQQQNEPNKNNQTASWQCPKEDLECCAPWSFNTDTWFAEQYEWELATQNNTHTCFAKIPQMVKASYFRQLQRHQQRQQNESTHDNNDRLCGPNEQRLLLGPPAKNTTSITDSAATFSNWARTIAQETQSLHSYYYKGNQNCTTAHSNSNCFVLPFRHCRHPNVNEEQRSLLSSQKEMDKFRWLQQYTLRPQHKLRRQVLFFLQQKHNQTSISYRWNIHNEQGGAQEKLQFIDVIANPVT